ncbi:HAMP domain-containing sensor histidine kinase [Actinoplanes sp. NPDC023801]|uniref:sensor histidine kinase n=1 Tax=Actinoplanes sp. NPDC023801 TaxID=3154595 RepID=UPI0033E3FB81
MYSLLNVHRAPDDASAGGHEAELRTLLAMASHDLNSPLTSIAAHVEMLRSDYADALGEDFAEDLAAIERGLRRMTRMTRDLVDHAKADHPLDPVPTSLRELVAEAVADHTAGPTPPEITVTGTLPDILADADLLRRVFDNLIGNAVKYTRPGETPQINVNGLVGTDATVLIRITDRGIGVPAGDRPKVFDAFHRCHNSRGYPGTGLGLASCRRIVERLGGRIGVTGNPGGGSLFWFTLPGTAR